MPATILGEANAYATYNGKAYVFCRAVANPANGATRTEIDAGHDFTDQIQAVNGLDQAQAFLDAPNFGNPGTPRALGRSSYPDSGFVTYQDLDGPENDVRSLWASGDRGFILSFDNGDIAGNTYDIFPVSVGAVSKGNADGLVLITTSMAVTKRHAFDLVVPAHAA